MPATAHGDASTANSNEFRKRMKKLDKKLMVVRKTNQAQKCINEFSEIVRQYVLRYGHSLRLAERYRVVCEMFESRISPWIYTDCIRPDVWQDNIRCMDIKMSIRIFLDIRPSIKSGYL